MRLNWYGLDQQENAKIVDGVLVFSAAKKCDYDEEVS